MKDEILILLKNKSLKPGEIAVKLKISRQALHKYLRELLLEKSVQKSGSGPHVSYTATTDLFQGRVRAHFDVAREVLLPEYMRRVEIPKPVSRESKKPLNFGYLIESAAVYSSNIEGNTMNLNSFLNSRMTSKKHRPKEAEEIEDLVLVYHLSQKETLLEKNMLKAHAILSRTFVTPSGQGKYRQEPVGVFSQNGLEYMAVEPQYVQHEMRELFQIIQELLKAKQTIVESFFWASWIHLMIALIHPFRDGNGRTSRLCEKWFLAKKCDQQMYFLQSEQYYWEHRSEYYAALKLGVNYWETDLSRALPFFLLLPRSLPESA